MNDSALSPYFANLSQWWWPLAALPVCAAILYGIAMKRRALSAFASSRMMPFLAPFVSWPRQYVRAALISLAVLAAGIAMLGPRWGTYYEEAHARHLDLMICLDVSRSMLAEDAGMSRLNRAKDDINRLLDRLSGASIGLVVFAGKPDLACPLTDDYEFYRLELEDVGVYSALVGGTDIGGALASAHLAFGPPAARDRAIILITDGEDHGGTAPDEARKALDDGIHVYTIGIGEANSRDGAPIPIDRNGQRTYLTHDQEQVRSKLNPSTLAAIAQAGGGEYHLSGQVTNRERTLEWIYAQRLAKLQQEAESEQRVEQKYQRSHWFAAIALGLLIIDLFMSDRRSTPLQPHGETATMA